MKLLCSARRFGAFALLALALLLSGCSGVEYVTGSVRAERPQPGQALVVFYREDRVLHSGANLRVRDQFGLLGQTHIGGLRNGTYFTHQAAPGHHVFSAATEVRNYIIMDLQPGRTYYVRCAMGPGVVFSRPKLALVPAEIGAQAVAGLRPVRLRIDPATGQPIQSTSAAFVTNVDPTKKPRTSFF